MSRVRNRADRPSRARGRPRSAAAREAILAAARALLEEGGITAVTMEGIAARAGVGKPTIYRTWPNAQAVAMAAMMKAPERESEPRHLASRAPLARLKRQLREVVAVFNSKMGRNVAIMIAAASQETELSKSFRNHFILARREEGRQMLDDALAAGELRRSISMEVALDMIYGPIFYRLLMGHAPLEDAFTDAVLEHALQGLRSSP